jgi:hypothetical protein
MEPSLEKYAINPGDSSCKDAKILFWGHLSDLNRIEETNLTSFQPTESFRLFQILETQCEVQKASK